MSQNTTPATAIAGAVIPSTPPAPCLSIASRISLVAKPLWVKKLVSSATTTARLSDVAMRLYGTHVHCTRTGRPAWRSTAR